MAVGAQMNYKNLPIKNAKFYQAVVINQVMSTYIQNPKYVDGRVDSKKDVKLELCPEGLLVESESEFTIVSWNNLASVTLDKTAQVEAEQPKQAKQYKTSEEVSAALKDKKASKDSETVDFRKI